MGDSRPFWWYFVLVSGLLWAGAGAGRADKGHPLLAVAPFSAEEARAYQAAWAEHLGMEVEIENSIGMKFRVIPPGEFMMGSPNDEAGRWVDEGPQHRVRITRPYYMGVYPVTQSQWKSVMGSNPSEFSLDGRYHERVSGLSTDHFPVEFVSWGDVRRFLEKLNAKSVETDWVYRLPTEAEWEYACRVGTTTRFHFGDDEGQLGEYAWYLGNSGEGGEGRTHRVDAKRPNAWGLYDLYGNVWEWCQDRFSAEAYAHSPLEDPTGPATGTYRVNRGGSWDYEAEFCRSASRGADTPGRRRNDLGFRVVFSWVE